MIQMHNRLIRLRTIHVGDLVLAIQRPILTHKKIGSKFELTWEGPFMVEKFYNGGSYQLVDYKGEHLMLHVNGQYLKKYYDG